MGAFKNKGPFLGVLIIRIMICWGLYWGFLFMEAPKSAQVVGKVYTFGAHNGNIIGAQNPKK